LSKNIPTNILESIETISELKVLLYLVNNNSETSIRQISLDLKTPRNSISSGLKQLVDKNIIKVIGTKGHKTTYGLTFEQGEVAQKLSNQKPNDEWKTVVAKRKDEDGSKTEHSSNIYINIKDFKDINLYKEDINSLTTVNENIYLSDQELGKLARRILVEWFLPMTTGISTNNRAFFPQQINHLKDLLVEYRTEQVLAGIMYWVRINPPRNGINSLGFLKFKNKTTNNMLKALDYFKSEYINSLTSTENEEAFEKAKKTIEEKEAEQKRQEEERNKVASMSSDDFLSSLLAGINLDISKE
jgi:DNA-binding transcriptional regulator GbsR (MarR family)